MMHALQAQHLRGQTTRHVLRHSCPRRQNSRLSCSSHLHALQDRTTRLDTYAFLEDPLPNRFSIETQMHPSLLPEWRKFVEEQNQKALKTDSRHPSDGNGGGKGRGNGKGRGGGGGGNNGGGGSWRSGFWGGDYWWTGGPWDGVCWLAGTWAVAIVAAFAQAAEELAWVRGNRRLQAAPRP